MVTESGEGGKDRGAGSPGRSPRFALRAGLILALLAWCGVALLLEVRASARPPLGLDGLPPALWRVGGPQVEPLRELLRDVGRRAPLGATIHFTAPGRSHGDEFFLFMWAVYELPRFRVARAGALRGAPDYRLVMTPPEGSAADRPPSRGPGRSSGAEVGATVLVANRAGRLERVGGSGTRGGEPR